MRENETERERERGRESDIFVSFKIIKFPCQKSKFVSSLADLRLEKVRCVAEASTE